MASRLGHQLDPARGWRPTTAGVVAAPGMAPQPIQRTTGSSLGTGAGWLAGWPTTTGATGMQSSGRPRSRLPSGVFR